MPGNSENFNALIVVNPRSANGTLGRKWERLAAVIRKHFGSFEHRFTERHGDATAITRKALTDNSHEMVVAMGGDGTISEVADGFFTEDGPVRPDAVLGVLPFGTGGDFRRTINASRKLSHAAASLHGRATRSIDAGRLKYMGNDGRQHVRHFINIASFGISGLVSQLANNSTKALGGKVTFALATLRAMWRFSPQRARLRFDGGEAQSVLLHTVAVANGRYFGGGMKIAPQAELNDGLFDVVTLGPLSWGDILLRSGRFYKGTHLELSQITRTRAALLEAEPEDPDEVVLLDVDGETPGRLPASFEVLPNALRLKWDA